jgi:signal transduction histidine kinase
MMKVSLYSIYPLLSSLFVLFLGLLSYFKHRQSPVNRAFARFSIFGFIWLFCYGVSYSTNTEQQALFWLRIGYTGVIFIPVGFYHFAFAFLNLKSQKKQKIILISSYFVSFLFAYSLWRTDYFVTGLYKYFWGYYPKAGFLHPYYLAFTFFIVNYGYFLFLKEWFKVRSEISTYRNRLQYIFSSYVILAFTTTDFIQNYGVEIYPLGWAFVIIYSSIIAYAILRYRLMDIYIYIKRTAAYSLSVGLLTAVFVVIILTLTRYVTHLTEVSSFSITVIAAMLIALLFNPLRNRIQIVIDKLFYKKTYDFYDIIQKTSRGLTTKLSLDAIYDFIGKIIFNTLGLSSLYLLSASVGGYYRVVYRIPSKGSTEGNDGVSTEMDAWKVRIEKNSGVVKLLNKTKKITLCELLNEEDVKEEEREEIERTLAPFRAEVIVPVFVDDKLSHIMLLGRKTSGDVFSLEDIHLLNTLSNQTSVAIKQAWLYSEKVLSEKLASIGMMSATFAHEIRNSLTSLRTFAQLMPERYYDPDFRETFTRVVFFDIARIEGLIKDLLDFSSPTGPKGEDKFNLTRLIDETVDYIKKKFELQKKHITIEKNYEDIEIKLSGDVNRLKQAFVNIMSNGCQAMYEGGTLKVDIVPDGKNVNVSISDTGEGIAPDDIDRIFEPFYTTKEKGIGLGLAISKKAIEENGGNIKVESTLGKGTTFTIILPLTES